MSASSFEFVYGLEYVLQDLLKYIRNEYVNHLEATLRHSVEEATREI